MGIQVLMAAKAPAPDPGKPKTAVEAAPEMAEANLFVQQQIQMGAQNALASMQFSRQMNEAYF